MCVDALASQNQMPGKDVSKMKSRLYQGNIAAKNVMLMQPLTYMNLSGEALLQVTRFYKIPHENILMVYDDIDLPFGKLRFRPHGSAGTHNGMRSIIQVMGISEISRFRIGVGKPAHPTWELRDFVLGEFSPPEKELMPKLLSTCADAVTCWLTHGTQSAMNRFNAFELIEMPEEADPP